MGRGHLLGVEAFLLFLAWMLVLSVVWSDSAQHVNAQLGEWKKSRALETSIALSDALILTHHTQPWKGCAVFDDALQRVRSYVLSESCLQNLSSAGAPSTLIARVSLHHISFDVNYFSRAVDENETCASVRRPIFLSSAMESVFLDVISCA